MKTIKSIKNKFIKSSTPGIGRITFDINFDTVKHIKEIEMALVLKNMFGGNIKLLQENDYIRGVKYPDYVWNGKYWELKECTSLISIDTRLRKANRQIKNKSNIGGIILNINNQTNTNKEIIRIIENRMNKPGFNNKAVVIVVLNNKIFDVYMKNTTKALQGPR